MPEYLIGLLVMCYPATALFHACMYFSHDFFVIVATVSWLLKHINTNISKQEQMVTAQLFLLITRVKIFSNCHVVTRKFDRNRFCTFQDARNKNVYSRYALGKIDWIPCKILNILLFWSLKIGPKVQKLGLFTFFSGIRHYLNDK